MLVAERHAKILEVLEEKNAVTLDEFKKIFSVSESTLRNDLRTLEELNKLHRSHGGALKIVKDIEVPYSQRSLSNHQEKERIGREAAKRIIPFETVYLDAGTTIMELAKSLPSDFEFNVVTSALNIATMSSKNSNISVHVTGGLLRPTLHELVGPKCIQSIKEIRAQKLFLCASGLDLDRGVTENHIFSAEVKKAMIDSSEQVILLLDSSKIGKYFFTNLAPLQRVDVLITDVNIPEHYDRSLQELGIEVVKV
ncbi:DeoR/GlpR family DNA-binding transcription regulator [Bacillus sp. REN16]|uniref:DeoR/GlpR family DNA-binding transcription regulator n=1 Tax=Bacillus sp. REN16 TaxID=2887296 RepID=UPI001E46A684|nr:DeoR/GlpR family DNA-binding transcription regulator [Bacillus sp. REN16]MCC3355929.1 DeoR/GlpR family DNA-binding transcription regulator [Bacillus sp. REN16]